MGMDLDIFRILPANNVVEGTNVSIGDLEITRSTLDFLLDEKIINVKDYNIEREERFYKLKNGVPKEYTKRDWEDYLGFWIDKYNRKAVGSELLIYLNTDEGINYVQVDVIDTNTFEVLETKVKRPIPAEAIVEYTYWLRQAPLQYLGHIRKPFRFKGYGNYQGNPNAGIVNDLLKQQCVFTHADIDKVEHLRKYSNADCIESIAKYIERMKEDKSIVAYFCY